MQTGDQLRAARALLRIGQGELAELAGVSAETVKRLERIEGDLSANVSTVNAIRDALVSEGIIFTPGNGAGPGIAVRRDPPPVVRAPLSRRGKA